MLLIFNQLTPRTELMVDQCLKQIQELSSNRVVVVVLLFYVRSKQLRSCWDGQFNLTTLFLGRLRLPFLNQQKDKQKYVAGLGIEPGTSVS